MVIHETLLFFSFAYFITMLMSQGSWKITPLWIFFVCFENQDLKETLLNHPKSVIRAWWSCGGTFSIHTMRASIYIAYWAKLWVRELFDLRVCEKEIQEKTSRFCLAEEIRKITRLWIWKPIRGKVVRNKILIPRIDLN